MYAGVYEDKDKLTLLLMVTKVDIYLSEMCCYQPNNRGIFHHSHNSKHVSDGEYCPLGMISSESERNNSHQEARVSYIKVVVWIC